MTDDLNEDFDNEIEESTDFSDLDELLHEATAQTEEDRKLKAARKRLAYVLRHDHPTKETEKEQLVALIRSLEENRIWFTCGTVALFHTQTCEMCGSRHSYFMGWMTEQRHATDPNARRLISGRPIEAMPERREDHNQGTVECCSNCVECVIAINQAVGYTND